MKGLLNRIFNHSVTTVVGAWLTTGLAFVAHTYQPGMSLEQYAMVLLPLVAGALLKDPGKTV